MLIWGNNLDLKTKIKKQNKTERRPQPCTDCLTIYMSVLQFGISFFLQILVNFYFLHPKIWQIGFIPHDSAESLMVASWGSYKDPEAKSYVGSVENNVMIHEQFLSWAQVECIRKHLYWVLSLLPCSIFCHCRCSMHFGKFKIKRYTSNYQF